MKMNGTLNNTNKSLGHKSKFIVIELCNHSARAI